MKHTLFVGAGSCGSNILNSLLKKENGCINSIQVVRNKDESEGFQAGTIIHLNGDSPEQVRSDIEKRMPDMVSAMRGKHRLVLFAGMGGITGSYASTSVVKLAQTQGISTQAFVVMPFNFEGESRMNRAKLSVFDLSAAEAEVTTYFNEDLIEKSPEDTSMITAFHLLNQQILDQVTLSDG